MQYQSLFSGKIVMYSYMLSAPKKKKKKKKNTQHAKR